MKRLGLLGGMSWESTAEYYRMLNEDVLAQLSGLHSADCVLRSVDFAKIELLQREGRWEEAGARLADEARRLVAAERSWSSCAPTRCTRLPKRSAPRSRSRSSTSLTLPPRPFTLTA